MKSNSNSLLKIVSLFTLTLFFIQPLFAKIFNCQFLENTQLIDTAKIETSYQDKILIFKKSQLSSYITEKHNNQFEIDTFIPDKESRIYSQSTLKTINEEISSSIWSRDYLFEIKCTLVQ